MAIETTASTAAASVSAAALATIIVGPTFGPYVAILVAALGGALWPLSMAELSDWRAGAWLYLRCVATGCLLTSLGVSLLAPYVNAPHADLHVPVACIIAALGNGVRPIIDGLTAGLAALANKVGGNK